MELSRIPNDGTIRVSHFLMSGQTFVFVDCLSIADAYDRNKAKKLAYNFRYAVNMPTAGIESYGSPMLLQVNDNPPCLFSRDELLTLAADNVYRAIFKLTPSL